MKSPCRAACKNEGGICIGCKRTMKEVLEWRDLGDEGRDKIMGILDGEIQTHYAPSVVSQRNVILKWEKKHAGVLS